MKKDCTPIPKPTEKYPVIELYMVKKENTKLFIDGSGDGTTDRRKAIEFELDAPKHIGPPQGMLWRYVRLKKPTPFY